MERTWNKVLPKVEGTFPNDAREGNKRKDEGRGEKKIDRFLQRLA